MSENVKKLFEQKQGMKYGKEPIKGKSIRKLFRDNGYKL